MGRTETYIDNGENGELVIEKIRKAGEWRIIKTHFICSKGEIKNLRVENR